MRRVSFPIVAVCTLAGCGALRPLNPGGADTGGTDLETDSVDPDPDDTDPVATGDVAITGVDPAWGSNGGGSLVTITGGPFAADARVLFDGVPSPHLAAINVDSIVATVPTTTAVGMVDITVESDGLTGTLPASFQMWEDASGKYGVYGELGWYVTKGDYWDPAPAAPFFSGFAYFVEPTNDPYWKVAYSNKLDSCSLDYVNTAAKTAIGATSLTFASGPDTITLLQDAGDPMTYAAGSDTVTGADVTLGAVYALEPVGGGILPEFTASAFATIPGDSPDVETPALDGKTVPIQDEDPFTFTWGTPFDGDYVVIEMLRTRPNVLPYYIERVTCAANDDGSFRVPSGTFTDWDSTKGDMIYIWVGRAVESDGILPYNNAKSGVVGVHWDHGVAYAR